MSGLIWGYIEKKSNITNIQYGLNMLTYMEQYKIDNYKWLLNKNVFMGCGILYITEESEREVLPFYDKDDEIIITADAIIDNREELLDLLNLSDKKTCDYTDSEYILMSYKKWGKDCVNYLLGDFTFVIYSIRENSIFCARDQVGQRTLYYYNNDEIFAFCTVSDPLLYGINKDININERWLTDFLSIKGVGNISENVETINENILQIQPAHILIVDNKGLSINEYWNPLKKCSKIKLKSEEECIEKFLHLFTEAINCRLRCKDNVGIMLSSGLDSASVAAIAASLLKKNNKVLKSYTSIPIYDSDYECNNRYIPNESEWVKKIVDYVGNIDMKLCDFKKENVVNNIDKLINIYGQPYKIIENSYWLNNILEVASKDKCKVVLTGQFGNATISYGDLLVIEKTLIKKCRILKAIKEVNESSKIYNVPKKRIYKKIIITLLPYKYRKYRNFKAIKKNLNDYFLEYCPVNKDLFNKWNVRKRFEKLDINTLTEKYNDLKKTRKSLMNQVTRSHLYSLQVNISLANGLLRRDPTSDKRIIEFCMNLPCDLFVNNGVERYLIRKSMVGLLPNEILNNYKDRGLQGADWMSRLKDNWSDTYIEISKAIHDERMQKYIDKKYLSENLSSIKVLDKNTNLQYLRMYLIVLILNKYLKEREMMCNLELKGGEIYEKDMVKT